MNKNKEESLLNFLQGVKKDCLSVRKYQDLTGYGQGQLDLINQILKELN